jgi:phage/plasmid-like protein (TIGR03299 family)
VPGTLQKKKQNKFWWNEILFYICIELNTNRMSQENRTNEVLDQVGLNWTVREEKLLTASGIEIPSQKAIVRDDTNQVLSVHGDGYYPYQNYQLIELLDKVSQQIGLPIHRGGMFGDGKKVFIQLKSNDLRLGDDKVEGFITGVNSFDGTTSLAFGPSNITISCQNTFFAAFRNLDTKVRHTKNMIMRVDEIARGLEMVVQEEANMFEDIKKMSETRFSKETRDWATKLLFNISKEVALENEKELSTVTKNRLIRFDMDMKGELDQKGDNLWGLFSGVTKYTTHSLSKGDNSENKMFGIYGQRERQIFKELAELV